MTPTTSPAAPTANSISPNGHWRLSLTGHTALVCGASSGIGQATALALAELGANVIVNSRSETSIQKTLELLSGSGHSALACDLNDHAKLSEMVTGLLKTKTIDIVVNNSAGPKGGPLLEAKPEEFLSAMNQHLVTNQILAALIVPKMKAKKFGRIVNIISTSVRTPIPNLGVSNSVRAAVASWAKTLATEVGPFGITVNSVLPGYTSTDRLSSLLKVAADKTGKAETDVAKEWQDLIPLRRFAEAAEVANAVAFLSSPAAAYITGVVLPVDGGRIPAI